MTPFKIQDLGSLPGYSAFTPNSINHTGNIVGTMIDVTLNTQSLGIVLRLMPRFQVAL